MTTTSSKGLSRRDFLKLVGVTGAGAVAGCAAPPAERLLPYVTPPDDQILGIATWYATTCLECPAGCGLHVRTREGRILKLEGNPDHPVNRGTLCARGQAQLQGLYNPDRIPGPKAREGSRWVDITWEDAYKRLGEKLSAASATPGAIQFWTEGATGSWNALVGDWCGAFGAERVAYEAFDYAPVREAAKRAFGTATVPLFDLAKAGYILSLGADFLDTWGLPLAQARGYDASHSARGSAKAKHVQAEPRLSLTGHSADEWIPIRPGTEGVLALGLAQAVGAGGTGYDLDRVAKDCDVPRATLDRVVKELSENRPAVVLGPGAAGSGANATEVWTAAFALNRALGAIGTVVQPSPGFDQGAIVSFAEARKSADRLASGTVKLFLVHGTNPVYTMAGTGFEEALRKAEYRVSFSSYLDETTALCDLVLPDLHALESWGDAEPVKGVRGLVQPAMRPVFEKAQQTGDVLLALARQGGGARAARFPDATFREYVMRRWGGTPDAFNDKLQKGGEWPAELPGGGVGGGGGAAVATQAVALAGSGDFTLYVYPHPYHYDGRGANKPWLLEIPDPVTKVAWESWCEVHPDTARRLGVENGIGLVLETEAGHAELPVITNPLVRADVIAVPLGLGHAQYGRYAQDRGVNALTLLPAAQDASSGGRALLVTRVRARSSGKDHGLVHTGGPGRQHDRGIARAIPLTLLAGGAATGSATPPAHGEAGAEKNAGAFSRGPAPGPEGGAPPLTFPGFRDRTSQLDGTHEKAVPKESIPAVGYNQYNRAHHRWGMAVDLSSCIGCSACVAACYAENNIAWVGKQNMQRGREMAWIRIERYYEDVDGGIEPRFVPMMCQQCGSAPCETVCPVYATYHNPEGLNIQVYNRCVGTRYCSNNCPYKVRAFNWFDYDCWVSPLHLQLNPDLTVRSKGVMEKCTFCVQRIRQARDVARDENRDVKDGDITPACAQTCPTQAIVFGDLADPESRVAKLAQDRRGYHVLEDLNTLPAITYLQKVSRRAAPAAVQTEHGGA